MTTSVLQPPMPSSITCTMLLEALPVELIADILSELDLDSLIRCSYLSKRLHLVASDPALNPWRKPILRNLIAHNYEPALKHLSVRMTVPRHNWVEILSLAHPSFLLFEATLPNLKESEWEECFKRRFLPSWRKWKREGSWKEGFLKCAFSHVCAVTVPNILSKPSKDPSPRLAPEHHLLHCRRSLDKVLLLPGNYVAACALMIRHTTLDTLFSTGMAPLMNSRCHHVASTQLQSSTR